MAEVIVLHNWVLDGEAVRGTAANLEHHFKTSEKKLATVSETYTFIEHLHETRNLALNGIITDLGSNFFTGTKINYVRNTISHRTTDLECFGLHEIQERNIEGDYFDNLIKMDDGLNLMQVMFGRLNVYDIPDMLYAVTGKRAYLQLDHPAARRIPSDKIVSLNIDRDGFKINCDNLPRDAGRARGLYIKQS